MFNRNAIWVGLLIGLILPVMGFLLFFEIFNLLETRGAANSVGLTPGFRERTSALVAIALNLIPLSQFRKRRFDQSMRGIVIITGLLALVWVIYFAPKMF